MLTLGELAEGEVPHQHSKAYPQESHKPGLDANRL